MDQSTILSASCLKYLFGSYKTINYRINAQSLTVFSMHVCSLRAPQQPMKPMMTTITPAPIRT